MQIYSLNVFLGKNKFVTGFVNGTERATEVSKENFDVVLRSHGFMGT